MTNLRESNSVSMANDTLTVTDIDSLIDDNAPTAQGYTSIDIIHVVALVTLFVSC